MSSLDARFDAVIVGGGAAGLVAAISAAERGARVILLEKTRRPGVKILMSGGTRCNITNARGLRDLTVVSGPIDPAFDRGEALGARSIQHAFGAGGKFLGPALKAFSVERTVGLFESQGVATKIEGNGKVFPVSDRAADVLAALLKRLQRSGAELCCDAPVRDLAPGPDHFRVDCGGRTIVGRRMVIAVGGQSYPGCGTSGDGYTIARRFGHTIVDPRPALVPVRVEAEWVRSLKGLTVPDAQTRIQDRAGKILAERREAVLFAHFGLTGPAILDISRAVARHDGPEPLELVLDFVPDARLEEIDHSLQTACRAGRSLVVGCFPAALPRRLAEALITAADVPLDRRGQELSRAERLRLVGNIKGLRLSVAGTLGFAKAEVTSGGVALDEVDPRTLESRRQPRLHFAGEVLDLDGLIGGYNFQAAWSTGWLAGESVSSSA